MPGCILFPANSNKTADINNLCRNAKHESRIGIEKIDGKILIVENPLTAQKINGNKKINGIWCWKSEEWGGMWIGGMCYGNIIKVGCNPNTKDEVSYDMLLHECGHYWLMNNYNIENHPAKYNPIFHWSQCHSYMSRNPLESIREIYDNAQEGDIISIHGEDANNLTYSPRMNSGDSRLMNESSLTASSLTLSRLIVDVPTTLNK